MNSFLRTLVILIFLFAVYHLIRDVLQIMGVENILTGILHWDHVWCGQYCNQITLPVEAGAMIGSAVVLKRNRLGRLGIFVLYFPLLMLAGTLLLP